MEAVRRPVKPYGYYVHADLLTQLNDLQIAIKLHHCHPAERKEKPEQWAKAQSTVPTPTWDDVLELLSKAHDALSKHRASRVKY